MFTSNNIPALFKKGTLKLIQNAEGEYRRVAEAQLVIEPLPVELARELGDEIAGHLFDDADKIREELEAIDLRVRAGLQHVTVRLDDALEPIAVLSPASIKDVSATLREDMKSGRAWLSLSFVVVFSLEEKAARNFVLDQFGRPLLWSFECVQRELDGLARVKEAAARLVEIGGADGGSVCLRGTGFDMTLDHDDAARLRQEASNLRKGKAH